MLSGRNQQIPKSGTKLLPKILFLLLALVTFVVAVIRDVRFVDFQKQDKFYSDAETYWENQEISETTMVGGANLSNFDVEDSKKFIEVLKSQHSMGGGRALDCASGIGRVSKHVLIPSFQIVDMLDVTRKFINASETYLGSDLNSKIGEKYVSAMQYFTPKPEFYDLIWMQWVSTHLLDKDLVEVLKKMKTSLKPNGFIVVKDNVSVMPRCFDPNGSFFGRAEETLSQLFGQAGLKIVQRRPQANWPSHLFPVDMFALQ